jgi:hypothetical protein
MTSASRYSAGSLSSDRATSASPLIIANGVRSSCDGVSYKAAHLFKGSVKSTEQLVEHSGQMLKFIILFSDCQPFVQNYERLCDRPDWPSLLPVARLFLASRNPPIAASQQAGGKTQIKRAANGS